MDKDNHTIYESYTKHLGEGVFDRMKARGAGIAQAVGGIKNTANKVVGGAKAAVGSAIGNKNMMVQGGKQAHAATQQANAYINAYGSKASLIPNARIPSMANFAKDVLEKSGR